MCYFISFMILYLLAFLSLSLFLFLDEKKDFERMPFRESASLLSLDKLLSL